MFKNAFLVQLSAARASLFLVCLLIFGTHFAASSEAAPQYKADLKSPSIETQLQTIEEQYDAGSFDDAARQLNEILIRDESLPRPLRTRAYLIKARLALAFGHHSELHLWLGKAKLLDPELKLDPVKDPPPLITVWREKATN
jgi:hypothetical protein